MGNLKDYGPLTTEELYKGLRKMTDAIFLLNRKDRRFRRKFKRPRPELYNTPLVEYAFDLFRHGWNEIETAFGILIKEYTEKEPKKEESQFFKNS